MQHCISFIPTIQKSLQSKNNIDKWNESLNLFENKEYRNSIFSFFDYMDTDIVKHYANPGKNQLIIPQGSAIIIIDIDEENISIRAPFVKLPAEKQLPVLRKCSEINFANLILPQILLQEDILSISYNMPIALCEPYKLYDVLRDIAVNADKYDDEFVSKFGAVRLMEPQISYYPEQELQAIIGNAQRIAGEALDYAAYFESKRDEILTSDALFIGINRIKYYCNPAGIIGNKLSDAVESFYGRGLDMAGKIKTMRLVLESVKNLQLQDARDAINISYQLIPLKGNANRSYLKDWIAKQYDEAASMLNKEYYSTATSYCLYTLYIILADFNIDENSRQAIEYTLQTAGGKPWKESAETLMQAMDFFYKNELESLPMDNDEVFAGEAGEDYLQTINNVMGQYKSVLSNFMKSFSLK